MMNRTCRISALGMVSTLGGDHEQTLARLLAEESPKLARGLELVKREFRRFLNAIMLIPCQIVRTARRVIYRILGYNSWLTDFFETWERLQKLKLVE